MKAVLLSLLILGGSVLTMTHPIVTKARCSVCQTTGQCATCSGTGWLLFFPCGCTNGKCSVCGGWGYGVK
jgi:hypothetical protein